MQLTDKQKRAVRKLSDKRYRGRLEGVYGYMTNVDAIELEKLGYRLCHGNLAWERSKVSKGDISSSWFYFQVPKKALLKLIKTP